MTPWIRLTLPLSALLLQACVSTPDEVATTSDVGASTGSTSGGPGPSTTPGTTMPGEDTMGTQGGTGMETTTGAVDTTAGVSVTESSTTVDPSTSSSSGGETSSSSGPQPECMNDDECANNQICDMGNCVGACGGAWGNGTYAGCLNDYGGFDTMDLCGADHLCIYDADPIGGATCSRQSCVDACDCPEPAATGDATVTCGEITGNATNDCYLSCGDGETCPTGMDCFAGYLCLTPVGADVPLYGNCGGLVPDCAAPGFCFVGGGGESVCQQDCTGAGAGDCPAGPPTGTAVLTCGYANMGNPGTECYLDCGLGQTCPDGMTCTNGYLCAFP